MPAKYASWAGAYRNEGTTTAISRLTRGGPQAEIEAEIGAIREAPDLVKRVFIVTSSLSRADVAQAFAAVTTGPPPRAPFVQLPWLLPPPFGACVEIDRRGGVQGKRVSGSV